VKWRRRGKILIATIGTYMFHIITEKLVNKVTMIGGRSNWITTTVIFANSVEVDAVFSVIGRALKGINNAWR
jgi:hypothetical protein